MQQGRDVHYPKLGAHVAGMTMGGSFFDYGAYAEYVKVPAELVWVVPEGTLTHEEAATVSVGYVSASLAHNFCKHASRFFTAVQCLYHPRRLALVEPPEKASVKEWILVNGASCMMRIFIIDHLNSVADRSCDSFRWSVHRSTSASLRIQGSCDILIPSLRPPASVGCRRSI